MTAEDLHIFPFNETLRPKNLSNYLGQDHLVGKGRIIHSLITNKRMNSMIFWGPPGTGKTTLSRIIVNELNYKSIEFSATISKITQIREVLKQAKKIKDLEGNPLVVFVDEIHHFNKHSQDAFLPYVERGDIILLGTTIENPAYKINRALLSRMKVLELYPLDEKVLEKILQKALIHIRDKTKREILLSETAVKTIVNYSLGDARKLLNLVELLHHIQEPKINTKMIQEIIQKNVSSYDRSGEDRYQIISAYHKSIRNSDTDAALYWLYRMLEGGEDPLFIIRRMVRIAVEDIGFADMQALTITLQAKEAFEFLGLPEGKIFLCQTTIYLASAPKSNSIYLTEKKMVKIYQQYQKAPIPPHIINPSNFIDKDKGAGKGYQYAHDFDQKTTPMETLPKIIREKDFYSPNLMGYEKRIHERIEYWKRIKKEMKKKSLF